MFFLILTGLAKANAAADLGPFTKIGSTKHGLYGACCDYSYFLGGILFKYITSDFSYLIHKLDLYILLLIPTKH